jgi:NAD(P)H dehydrogenase (quinone)
MARIAVVYHSGFGHTQKVAEAVARGAQSAAETQVDLFSVEQLNGEAASEKNWERLNAADGIIFGAPTYMGGVSAQFKTFIDASSKVWSRQGWKNKIAAGFTNSGSYSGDKLSSLFQLITNAMQHGMIWVSTGLLPSTDGSRYATPEDLNRIGSFSGLMTQALHESPETAPPSGDIKTAELFGQRVAELTHQFVQGRKLEPVAA